MLLEGFCGEVSQSPSEQSNGESARLFSTHMKDEKSNTLLSALAQAPSGLAWSKINPVAAKG
jgi:hypothetical protein